MNEIIVFEPDVVIATENETLEILEKVIREQGIETEEFIQNTLIKFINQNGLDTTKSNL